MELVILQDNRVTTTSLLIAEKFDKDHKVVLKAIRELECSKEFSRNNFMPSEYEMRGKKYPLYIITKNGFSMLVMGFTGKTAAQFKEDFIYAFDLMEEKLRNQKEAPLKHYTNRILSNPTKNLPVGYWSIFDVSHHVMLRVEQALGTKSRFDLIDGSIGKMWKAYRKGTAFGKEDDAPFGSAYPPLECLHDFEDQRGLVPVACYSNREYMTYKGWLDNVYVKEHLPDYLAHKYAKEQATLERVKQLFPKLIDNKKRA